MNQGVGVGQFHAGQEVGKEGEHLVGPGIEQGQQAVARGGFRGVALGGGDHRGEAGLEPEVDRLEGEAEGTDERDGLRDATGVAEEQFKEGLESFAQGFSGEVERVGRSEAGDLEFDEAAEDAGEGGGFVGMQAVGVARGGGEAMEARGVQLTGREEAGGVHALGEREDF